jgi:uroporphyrinogen decarboxylase
MPEAHEWKGPVEAQPDFENFLAVLRREKPSRPTLFEFFLNDNAYRAILGDAEVDEIYDAHGDELGNMLVTARAYRAAGYDYVTAHGSAFAFPRGEQHKQASISANEGALITDRASFEAYPWPDPADFAYDRLAFLSDKLPACMKAILFSPGGVLENTIQLVGYENLCYMLIDDPQLTRDVFDAVGSRLLTYYQLGLEHDCVGAVISNDDWGFKTQTMLPPDEMRKYVFPWHERIVAAAHQAGRPAILHSCGNLANVMDDVIDVMKFDGKHSYEDSILPVEQAYDKWGSRIAILGGIDVDFVIRSPAADVYARSRAMVEKAPTAYALGTGNSVPEYVPNDRYFAMIEAALVDRR